MKSEYQYCKDVVMFKYNMQKELENAWEAQEEGNEEQIEKLRKEPITISFGGKTLELADSATYGNCHRIKTLCWMLKGIENIRFFSTAFLFCHADF